MGSGRVVYAGCPLLRLDTPLLYTSSPHLDNHVARRAGQRPLARACVVGEWVDETGGALGRTPDHWSSEAAKAAPQQRRRLLLSPARANPASLSPHNAPSSSMSFLCAISSKDLPIGAWTV